MKTEAQIVQGIAEKACRSIAISVKREMQGMEPCLGSDFDNAWNELCMQIQNTESIYWDFYLETAENLILQQVSKLDDDRKAAIWHQIGCAGRNESEQDFDLLSIDDDDLVEFIRENFVWRMADS